MNRDGLKSIRDDAASSSPPPCGEGVKNAARRRDLAVAMACGVFVAFMVGMAYAAVPLYSWFCKTTGFGGIPQIASSAPERSSSSATAAPDPMQEYYKQMFVLSIPSAVNFTPNAPHPDPLPQ